MRLRRPRIGPAAIETLAPDVRELLEARKGFAGQDRPLNVLLTMARFPAALKRYLGWSDYILGPRNDLSPRLRELVILRTGWLARSGYEWTQHAIVGRECGLSDDEIARVKLGAGAPGWSALEAAALGAVDELFRDQFIGEAAWAALAPLGDKGRFDLIVTCGQYLTVSMMLNSLGVPLDPGQTLDPDLSPPEDARD